MEKNLHPQTPQFTQKYSPSTCRVVAPCTTFDIFPSSTQCINQSIQKYARRRRGLARLPLNFTTPLKAIECLSNSKAATPTISAVFLLDALRKRTLLDLSCMREFSLLRIKPLAERDLSRLSSSSAYDIHTQQLYLQQLAKPQSIQKEIDLRVVSPVKKRIPQSAHTHRKIFSTSGSKPPIACTTFTASPPPKLAHQQQMPTSRPMPHFRTKSTGSGTQKLSVTELHGFLQEQDMAALMAATGYSRAELFARWARFKALCSMTTNAYGVTKEMLRHGIPQLSVEDEFFVERAFEVLDADGSGALDWPEYIAALSVLEKGDPFRRLVFLFHAYDLNGDGLINRQEVELFFLASFCFPETPQTLDVVQHFVEKIFASLGREQSDSIRVEDAMAYLHNHPDIDAFSALGRTLVSTQSLH